VQAAMSAHEIEVSITGQATRRSYHCMVDSMQANCELGEVKTLSRPRPISLSPAQIQSSIHVRSDFDLSLDVASRIRALGSPGRGEGPGRHDTNLQRRYQDSLTGKPEIRTRLTHDSISDSATRTS
jgi:hypothetical protein